MDAALEYTNEDLNNTHIKQGLFDNIKIVWIYVGLVLLFIIIGRVENFFF